MLVPTPEEFRAAGWTSSAIKYPLTVAAMKYRCRFNGITPEQAPRTWAYAPNPWVQADLEAKASNQGTAPHA